MRAMPTLLADDGPRFHPNMPVGELTERDTQAIEASVISSSSLVAKTVDMMTHEIRLTPTEPNGTRGLEPPDPNSGIQLTEVQRLTREGFEATSR